MKAVLLMYTQQTWPGTHMPHVARHAPCRALDNNIISGGLPVQWSTLNNLENLWVARWCACLACAP